MMLDDVTMIFKVLRPYLLVSVTSFKLKHSPADYITPQTWFACSALSDTLIAGTMVFVVSQHGCLICALSL